MNEALEKVFRDCFERSHNTILLGGAEEPLYEPAGEGGSPGRIVYREDYFSSALHEVAHWCIAGRERRERVDYGYWYAPDGRSSEQQRLFERLEIRPQAIEWHFSLACNVSFRVSADNLHGEAGSSAEFTQRVRREAVACLDRGLPPRAHCFRQRLANTFGGLANPVPGDFSV